MTLSKYKIPEYKPIKRNFAFYNVFCFIFVKKFKQMNKFINKQQNRKPNYIDYKFENTTYILQTETQIQIKSIYRMRSIINFIFFENYGKFLKKN